MTLHRRSAFLLSATALAAVAMLGGCAGGASSPTFASLQQGAAEDQRAANAVAVAAQDKTMQRCTAQGVAIASVSCPSGGVACAAVKLYEIQQMAVGDCAGVVAQEKQTLSGLSLFFATLGL